MGLTATIRKRIALGFVVVLGVSLITFTISHLIPTDVARMIAGDHADKAVIEAIRSELGLDRPLYTQYWLYVSRLLHGDLGVSIISGQPVLSELIEYLPATAELVFVALGLSVLVAVPLAVLSAVYKETIVDRLIRAVAVLGISTPGFWLGLMLIYLFYGRLGWLPGGGRVDEELSTVATPTGMYLLDSILVRDLALFKSAFAHIVLPAITLALSTTGLYVRLLRASLLDILQQDYIRAARANGLSELKVVLGYALPNALFPFVTALGLSLAGMLGGTVITEIVFSWPGIGNYVVQSIFSLDFPVIVGFTVFTSIIYVSVNLLVDITYLLLDPRVRKAG